MSKKHIMIVINSLAQGGAERVVSVLMEHYHDNSDFDVELVLLEDDIAYTLPKDAKVTLLSTLGNDDSSMKKTLFIPFLAYKLQKLIVAHKPDLIVSFLYRADFVNILASYGHKIPVIVSERVNASSTYNNASLNARINKFLIKKLYPKASYVINVSEGTKRDLIENFAICAQKQTVIYNPYDIEKIERLASQDVDISLPKDKTLIAVSRFRPIKNIGMILEAVAMLPKDIRLILVGDGSEEMVLKEQVKVLGLGERVLFVGAQENPYQYMSKAAIYISASRSEGFPNALVEAMICGCAVVSTDCPSGPREILAPDTENRLKSAVEYAAFGSLVAVDDTPALKESLERLLCDDAFRALYSQKAKERSADFHVSTILARYSETFSQVIEEGRA
jgi:N-acetylgalactosamine-N,N'-diacetylbacillosaminyl-diphospho-undecaprenol 4-alpha-N-acetylgalactosaminyltransferase